MRSREGCEGSRLVRMVSPRGDRTPVSSSKGLKYSLPKKIRLTPRNSFFARGLRQYAYPKTNDGAKTKLCGAPCAVSTPIANEQWGMPPAAEGGALAARLCAGRAERKVAGTNIGQCRHDRPTSQQVDVMAGKQAIRRRFTSADPTARDTHARVILEGEKATAEFRQSAGQRR